MYALAINASPRKGSNTGILLDTVLEPLKNDGWETEVVKIGGKPMRGCIACNKCFENKDMKCVIKTDGFNEIMEKMAKADAIILGSPTYFTDVTAEMKALIDRAGFVAIANGKVLAGKIGAGVVAVRRGGAVHVFDTLNHLFQISHMITPGSSYWNMVYGLKPGDVKDDQEGMANMKNLGETIAWLGKAIKPHMESFPKM
jgi:multimeric flavodoxin WrbA